MADVRIAVSGALLDMLDRHGIPNVIVLHNALVLDNWKKPTNEELRSFGDKHKLRDAKPIFFGGRLSPAKGGEAIIRALPEILASVHNARLLIAGKDSLYLNKLIKRAEALCVRDAIVTVGWLSGLELVSAYAVSDVVVVPSVTFDSLPTVVLEGMIMARSVVATCFGGAREMVIDGKTGFIVDPRQTSVLASNIIKLLTNSNMATSLGKEGRDRVCKFFDSEARLDELLKIYEGYGKYKNNRRS